MREIVGDASPVEVATSPMEPRTRHRHSPASATLILCGLLLVSSSAWGATRWGSVHMIPDADFLRGGEFSVDAHCFFYMDDSTDASFKPTVLADVGVIEWVNFEVGYAGRPTLGFKARILGETKRFMPTVTLGAHNVIAHQEYYEYGVKNSKVANEFYLAVAKTLEPLKMRLHLGIQTMPTTSKEKFNPYAAIEKYFGTGLYTTLEVHRRHEEAVPSLFLSVRLLKRRLEVSLGLVAFHKLFYNNGEFAFSFVSAPSSHSPVRPGIRFGLRFLGDIRRGRPGGFNTIDGKLEQQGKQIEELQLGMDSLRMLVDAGQSRLSSVDTSITTLKGGKKTARDRTKDALLDRIITLQTLYTSEPFDPEKVRAIIKEVVAYRERAIPPLKELLLDKGENRQVRVHSAMLLGELRSASASDALLSVLGGEADPGLRIETLIALGKIRETKATYMLEQLANDPDDAVALTAREVLDRLQKETGMQVKSSVKMRDLDTSAQSPETLDSSGVAPLPDAPPPVAAPAAKTTLAPTNGRVATSAAARAASPAPAKTASVAGRDSTSAAPRTLSPAAAKPASSTAAPRDTVRRSASPAPAKTAPAPAARRDSTSAAAAPKTTPPMK